MHSERRVVSDAATDRQESRAERAGARTVASKVDGLKVRRGRARATAAVTVRFWDGSTVAAQRRSRCAGRAHSRRAGDRALPALAQPARAQPRLGVGRARRRRRPRDGARPAPRDARSLARADGPRAAIAAAALRVGGARALRRPPIPRSEAAAARAGCTRCAATGPSVRHHYDVSNRFYELLLGPSMVYSCAYFARRRTTRSRRAQERKLELICRKLRLQPGERLLDIGCGWGSLVLHAAAHHGVRALGVTLSEPQAELARERDRGAGLADRVEVRVLDYRELDERAVRQDRERRHVRARRARRSSTPTSDAVHALLRPGGLFLNHGITRLHAKPPRGADVHQPLRLPRRRAASGDRRHRRAGGRRLRGPRRRVAARALRADAAPLAREPGRRPRRGRSPRSATERERVWRLYMLGSAQGFEGGEIGIYQTLAARDGAAHALPLDRAELCATERPPLSSSRT